MTTFFMTLILAGGISVRTPKIDTVLDWQVYGKFQNKHISVIAEKERDNGTLFNNYEASGDTKYARCSFIQNDAKDISRQEATAKYPWRTETGLFAAEMGLSIIWYDFDSKGKPAGFMASSFGNDTLKGSVKVYPTQDGLESTHILIEARTKIKMLTLHPFVKWMRIGDEKPYIQSKVELEFKIKNGN